MLKGRGSWGAEGVARALHAEGFTPAKVHKTTVIRAARREAESRGRSLIVRRGKPDKELSDRTKRLRLDFAVANANRDWSIVMFTDRKRFVFLYPGVRVGNVKWVERGSKWQARTASHPQCVNLYAGITVHGATKCHVVAGTSEQRSKHHTVRGKVASNITASEYREVLKKTLLPEGKRLFNGQDIEFWVLQQDNDPCHKVAKPIIEWRGRQGAASVQLLENWPPNSPDLSPIENVWSIVQAEVNKCGYKTLPQWKKAVLDGVRGFAVEKLAKLYASVPKRMAQVIERDGDRVDY